MTDTECLASIQRCVEKMDRAQAELVASQKHLTDHFAELHQDVREIKTTLNGPDGVLVRLDRTSTKLETVEREQQKCPARVKFMADATAPGVPAVTNAAEVLAKAGPPSLAPNGKAKVAVARWQALGILFGAVATVAGAYYAGRSGAPETPPAAAATIEASPAPSSSR